MSGEEMATFTKQVCCSSLKNRNTIIILSCKYSFLPWFIRISIILH